MKLKQIDRVTWDYEAQKHHQNQIANHENSEVVTVC